MQWKENLEDFLLIQRTVMTIFMIGLSKTILNDWTIIIPGASCSTFALSDWPAIGITRNKVKRWLEEKNHHKPDDLIDGACEPLAYYLSSSISNLNLSSPLEVAEEPESRYLSPNIYKQTKDILDQLEPRLAAEVIFGNYIKQETQSPQFWHETFGRSYKNFLFGHPFAKKRLLEIVASGNSTKVIIPFYVLCYLFNTNELTNFALKNTTVQVQEHNKTKEPTVQVQSTKKAKISAWRWRL
jgi:hypothetical protein